MEQFAVPGVLFSLNVALGIFMWLLKSAHEDLKEQLKENRFDIKDVKETYFKKADFKEFKEELWDRLDRFETDIKHQINKR